MDVVLVIARILFAGIFISSGISHLTKLDAMTGYAQNMKVPAAKLSVILSGLMILVGGLYVALGIYADLGALLLTIFLLLSAFKMHDFWNFTDAHAKQYEMTSFMKNLALAGASLIIFVLVGSGVEFGPTITEGIFNL